MFAPIMDSMIRTTTLSNGARIVTEVVDQVYSASLGFYVDIGSEHETEQNNGVSHFLEHILFKGTETRTAQQIAQEIEDVGGSLGAATGKENTCFYGRVMGEHLPVAIDLLQDMLLNSRFTDDDLEVERQVILEEIKMYEDDPEDFAHETLIANIWPGHPLSRPITGTHETVCGITREMLQAHVDNYYRPENMVVSIAGKFDEDAAVASLTDALSAISPGKPKPVHGVPTLNPFSLIADRDIEQAHISIATTGTDVHDDRRYVIAVLDLCLGGNMSSRLFQEVREKRGLVYSINTFREAHRNTGLFGIYAGASPRHVEQVLELVSKELKRTKRDGFTPQEIDRAKVQMKSELLLGLESMRGRSARNAYSELFFDRQLTVEEICSDIDKVTGQQVTALANQFLFDGNIAAVVVGPASELEASYAVHC